MVLGVGSDQNSKIPYGKGVLYQKGKAVTTKLERKDLTQLSAIAGGNYYELSNTRNDIIKLAQDIQLIETNNFSAHTVDAKANKYIYFLGFALLLMVIDALFTVKTLSIE
jgi:Ca-activated chloride channel homolog